MIVALDGTPLTLTSGGLRRYTEELSRALRAEFPDDEYHLLSDQLSPPRNAIERRWWTVGLPLAMARLGCDVFHGTNFAVPFVPLGPSVMSVHDISPWLDPSWHHAASMVRRRTPLLARLGIATVILTGTHAVKRQIVDLFAIHPDRVAVVPDAPAEQFQPTPAAPAPRPYFLFAGTVEPRKNVTAAITAWTDVRKDHDVNLIIAGRRRADGPVIEAQPGLELAGEVSDERLAELYSGAVALVYPSLYEGFGLPVVEAMRCGATVITSHDPALVEVSGGAALHASPGDLAQAMRILLCNPDERARRREASLRRAAEFSWARTAHLTREVYVEAIDRFRT
jgi:glycosyltransferase involved in cell wall biosynthesis